MKRNLLLLFFILFYYCGDEVTTNYTSINFYVKDQQFIDDLINTNGISDPETVYDRITTVKIDSGGVSYYWIDKLYLGSMELDSIPPSIGNLNNLSFLILSDNDLQYLTGTICSIYDQIDTLDVSGNDICTPNVPDCIINTIDMSVFYENQHCEIIPDEEDLDFILDLISENWSDTASTNIIEELNNATTWETFVEGNKLTSRITEIRYDDKSITNIPISLEDVDSLQRIELQNNQIEAIPNIIGNLSRLKYFTIQKNNIVSIPPRIGDLKNLEVFKIYENKLTQIHENIGQLSKLISLNLSKNQIESLPDGMCNILSNPGIEISIDDNEICDEDDFSDCFENLVNNASQPLCGP